MRGTRLKWRCLHFWYILSCFDPLICILLNIFVDSSNWPMMQYKVSPTNSVWSFMEGPPIHLWKTNVDFLQNFLLESPAMFNVAQFGAMMRWGWWRGRSLLVQDYPNTWNSRNKALNKTQLMQWQWIYMWIIGRMFCYICQNPCLLKGPLSWKALGLPTIGNWIMWELSCRSQSQLLI
jgi:hypothetical protein